MTEISDAPNFRAITLIRLRTFLGVGPSGWAGWLSVIDRTAGLSEDEGHGKAPNAQRRV